MSKLPENYWQSDFDIKADDLERIAERMRQGKRAFILTELIQRIIRGRLEHGSDDRPAVLPEWVKEQQILSWDEEEKWLVGSHVLVARTQDGQIKPCFGVIENENIDTFFIKLEGAEKPIKYGKVKPGSVSALKYYDHVRRAIWEKEQVVEKAGEQANIDEQIELIVFNHGAHIGSRLISALKHNDGFYTRDERWFLSEWIKPVPQETLKRLHRIMLHDAKPNTLDDLYQRLSDLPRDEFGQISLVQALETSSDSFQVQDGKWLAVKPPPPPWQKAVGAYYVYDPQTYRILLQPGQRLKKEQAERLEALGWYAEVVQPAE